MHLPEPVEEIERAWPAKAKREPYWLELCAEIAAISTMNDWEDFWPIMEERLHTLPYGWRDIANDAMIMQREYLLEIGR